MENSRKLVVFPVDQFYALIGTITMAEVAVDPYGMTLTDICNERSSATHGARDHLHRPGKLYLSAVEFYALHDNTRRVCRTLESIHLALKDIRGIIDYNPERYRGNPLLRQEHDHLNLQEGDVTFSLHGHVLHGRADEWDIYRLSEKFIGLHNLRIGEVPETANLSLPDFLARVGCPHPDYMAVNLASVFHS